MAYEVPGQIVGTVKNGSTSDFGAADQFKFVVLSSTAANTVVLPNTTGPVLPFGVVQNKPSTGAAATVMINGLSKVRLAGSTLAAGDAIGCSTAGYGKAVTTLAPRVGIILEGSSGSTGRVASVLLDQWATT